MVFHNNRVVYVSRRFASFSFEPLRSEHLPLLARWLAEEHVSPWFGPPAGAREDPLGERDAVRRFVASLGDRPIGLIQIYRWSDFPANAAAVGARVGEVGIDFLVGEASLIRRSVGPAMIRVFLARFAWVRGDVAGVRVDVSEANERSWRCLEKLGFRREREGVAIPGQEGRHYIYLRDEGAVDAVDQATVDRVVALAKTASPPKLRCRVLAIDGPGGAGKSALAIRVAREPREAPIIHTDDFAGWDDPLNWYERLLEQVLRPLTSDASARYQRYDWDLCRLAEWHYLEPAGRLILEGVGASRRAFRPYLAASVWVQTNRVERPRRGLERDGQDARSPWEEWMRAEDEYIAAERPDQGARIVVSGDPIDD